MTDVGRHPKITLLSMSEVTDIKGHVGKFEVKVHRRARLINEKECTACGDCVDVCPVVVPDEFNIGLSSRKAIYTPFPQAVPPSYLIDQDNCLGKDPIICGKCIEMCERNCIDFNMTDEYLEFTVGTIIVANGMEVFDPQKLDEYGYTRYENVITSLEFERLINASGPTQGKLVRITDRKIPHSISFIQCVGSRTLRRGEPYCSNICCMNTIKDTLLIKEHYPDIEIKVFYLDIRAFGKGFEELFRRSKSLGVRYIRGLPGQIIENADTKSLILNTENTATNKLESHTADMVILSVGIQPGLDGKKIREILSLQKTQEGFYLEAHPKLQPVDSATKGIFYAGCAEGPKDIKESVTQASAASARAMRLMSSGEIKVEATFAVVNEEKCIICGICEKVCPYNAISVDRKNKIPAKVINASCAGCGTCAAECPSFAINMNHFTDGQILSQIDAILHYEPEKKIIVFACNWCSYAGADFAGVSRFQYPPSTYLIRTMCSGRVAEKFIWHALIKGAAIVLVSGCHLEDCHYNKANEWTLKRMKRVWKRMEKLGISKERVHLEWISASEGTRFAEIMDKLENLRQKVTINEIKETGNILRPLVESGKIFKL